MNARLHILLAATGLFGAGLVLGAWMFFVAVWLVYPSTDFYKLAENQILNLGAVLMGAALCLLSNGLAVQRHPGGKPWRFLAVAISVGLAVYVPTCLLFGRATSFVDRRSLGLPDIWVGPPIVLAALVMFGATTLYTRRVLKRVRRPLPARPVASDLLSSRSGEQEERQGS